MAQRRNGAVPPENQQDGASRSTPHRIGTDHDSRHHRQPPASAESALTLEGLQQARREHVVACAVEARWRLTGVEDANDGTITVAEHVVAAISVLREAESELMTGGDLR